MMRPGAGRGSDTTMAQKSLLTRLFGSTRRTFVALVVGYVASIVAVATFAVVAIIVSVTGIGAGRADAGEPEPGRPGGQHPPPEHRDAVVSAILVRRPCFVVS